MLLSGGGVNYWHSVIASELDRVEEGTRVRMMPEKPEEKEANSLSAPTPASGDKSSSGEAGQSAGTDTVESSAPVDSGQEMIPADGGTDYAGVVMPEETDTLVLYSAGMLSTTITYAVELFEKQYPDVHIEWYKLGEEEFENKIRAEIPAGRGPDVFVADSYTLPDIYKTMSTGVFEDLNPYIANDADFDINDFYTGIMDEGVFRGSRYVMPLTHFIQPVAATEEGLAEAGCTLDNLSTFEGYLRVCTQYHDQYPGSNYMSNYGYSSLDRDNLSFFCQCCGFRFIDYENGVIDLDEDVFRSMIDLCKLYHGNKPNEEELDGMDFRKLTERKCLLHYGLDTPLTIANAFWQIRLYSETPVMLITPDIHDGKTAFINRVGAIPTGAGNKLNAWRFLKILLSDELQSNPSAIMPQFPVKKTILREYLSYGDYLEEDELERAVACLGDIQHGIMWSKLLHKYVQDNMIPYIEGKASFEDCYQKLLNTLELYKDE